MNWFQKLRLRMLALFQKEKLDTRMDDKHIEMQKQENIEAQANDQTAKH